MIKEIVMANVFITLLLLAGCAEQSCDGALIDGQCCDHVCKIACPDGFVEGSCNCECIELGEDMNLDDLFEDAGDIEPPILPI
ncbi:hypothetical protein HQ529_02400 [Candidatus Woesearchaeota archaeon]|nr:hypothetical protein [Candidatus Woesearchaeota archaeon]